ncbi:hypothetical protein K3495_g5463 [Podosphaera aphanis]|nr:hypothetical protein K3495_g5463 [Podosphaera aphanis]
MQQKISTHYRPNQQNKLTGCHSEILDETQYTSSESASGDSDENRLHSEISDPNEGEDQEQDQTFEVNESADGIISQYIAQENLQFEEPQPPPRRYSTRGANAKPSRKQAELRLALAITQNMEHIQQLTLPIT